MLPVIKVIYSVFRRPFYFFTVVMVATMFFLTSILAANYRFLLYIFTAENLDFKTKGQLLWGLLVAVKLNFSPLWLLLTIILALLLGINVALLISYFKRRAARRQLTVMTTAGLFSGFLGASCVLCGSVFLSVFLGFTSAMAFIGFLPFGGLEFGVFGIIILTLSLYLIIKNLSRLNCSA